MITAFNLAIMMLCAITATLQGIKALQKKDISLWASVFTRSYLGVATAVMGITHDPNSVLHIHVGVLLVLISDIIVHSLYFAAKKYRAEIELNKAIVALKNLNSKYTILVENSIVGYYVMDSSGTIEFVNSKVCDILKMNRDQLIGRALFDFVHPEDIPIVKENIRRRIQGEVPSLMYNFRMTNGKGEIVRVTVYGGKTTNGHDTITGVLIPTE